MKVFNDIKKIMSFAGEQLKSTFQMLSYLRKIKINKSPETPLTKVETDQNDATKGKKNTKTKKEKLSPPILKIPATITQQGTHTPKKKETTPSLNILTDEEPKKNKFPSLSWIKGINWSNPYIVTPAIILLLFVAILAFWIALEHLFPTPSSNPQIDPEPKVNSDPSIQKEEDSQPPQQEDSVPEPSEKHDYQEEPQQENAETPPSSQEEISSVEVESAPTDSSKEVTVVYQPMLDLEKTKGVIRTINPHFFMETPPLDSKGNPTNLPPRVIIILYNMGLNELETDLQLSELPEEITLSLSPYGNETASLIQDAKSQGYSVLMQMPWEDGNTYTDQGNLSIITGLSQEKTMELLNKYKLLLNTADGFFAEGGGKLMRHPDELTLTLKFIAATKNCLVAPMDVLMTSLHEKAAETKVNYTSTTIVNPDFKDIPAIENLAKRTGFAILAFPTGPKIIPQINEWVDKLEKLGIEIVPITKIMAAK